MRKRILAAFSAALFSFIVSLAVIVTSGGAAAPNAHGTGPQEGAIQVTIGPTDIGGVVTSSNGPEAGVWVIAETSELPTQIPQNSRDR